MVPLSATVRGWLGAAAVALAVSSAAAQPPAEESVKAAFLYNFTKFVDWPEAAFPGSSAPFHVCVVANERFRRELTNILVNEHVAGRAIAVTETKSDDDLKTCHLAYFDEDADRPGRQLSALGRAPVLTVGEGPRFLEQGGVIAFTLENNRVRFDISKRRADASGLNVSSKLLRVARRVEGSSAP